MTLLEKMISEGEHLHQDFKYFISDTKKISRSLAAFANTDGGRLLIGVKDNGKIVGLKHEDEEAHVIEAAATIFSQLALNYTTIIREWHGKRVLQVNIARSDNRPHTAPDETGKPTVYIRKADENKVANSLETRYLQIKNNKSPLSFNFSRSQERIVRWFNEHGIELSLEGNYDIPAIAASCMVTEKECLDTICTMILMEETGY